MVDLSRRARGNLGSNYLVPSLTVQSLGRVEGLGRGRARMGGGGGWGRSERILWVNCTRENLLVFVVRDWLLDICQRARDNMDVSY